MSGVLNLTIPFFALVFLGYFFRSRGFLDGGASSVLTRFAFFVALPPFMFIKVSAANAMDILNWGFVWRYELSTLIIFVGGALLAMVLFRMPKAEAGILGLNCAYPNFGYIGVPLSIMAFGDMAALPVALILLADHVVLLGLTAIFVSNSEKGRLQAMLAVLMTMARNPLLISVFAGIGFSSFSGWSGFDLPVMLDRFLVMLAGAAAPVALFALGATLFGQKIRAAIPELTLITLFKLILHPVLVAILFLAIPDQPLMWIQVAILCACLPVASNVFVLADQYGFYAGRTATAILVTTILASVTVPLTLYILFRLA